MAAISGYFRVSVGAIEVGNWPPKPVVRGSIPLGTEDLKCTRCVGIVSDMQEAKEKRWPGGRIHMQSDGRELFIIARTITSRRPDGSKATRRFHISTRCHTITAAMKQLERFEADPWSYSPIGAVEVAGVQLTAELIMEHRKWSLEVRRNTRSHANNVAHRLTEWQDVIGDLDLRRLTLREHIRPALDSWPTCRRLRIIALKSLFAWLRRERHLVVNAEDPTLDLAVPQATPEKAHRRKAVDESRVRAAWRKLDGDAADMLEVLAHTGMHVSELERFIRAPTSQLVVRGRNRATLITLHKSGVMTRIPMEGPAAIAAAQRLRKTGTVCSRFHLKLAAACKAARIEPFTPGVLRHSVATHAVKKGATPDAVAAMLHHKDRRTTEKFYIDVAAPVLAVPVMKMR